MGSELVCDTFSIRVMYPVKPFFQFVTDFAFVIANMDFQRVEKYIDVGQQIPVPKPSWRPRAAKRIAFFTLSQCSCCPF